MPSFPTGPAGPSSSAVEDTPFLDDYDYTEGASAVDIAEAIEVGAGGRRRRDSQVGSAYEGDEDSGAIFDGPASVVVPSSVSSMHLERHFEFATGRPRRSSSRRRSMDFGRRLSGEISREDLHRRQSGESAYTTLSTGGLPDEAPRREQSPSPLSPVAITPGSSRIRSRRLPSTEPREAAESPRASGFMENLASYFGHTPSERPTAGRRKSSDATRRSRRLSSDRGSEHALTDDDGDEEERWGYSSNEEYDDEDASQDTHEMQEFDSELGSQPPSPSASIPLLTGQIDPVFGDTRIEMFDRPSHSPPPPPGPPSRQDIYIADEDANLRFTGYEPVSWKAWLWFLGCCLTGGGLALLGRWLPGFWLKCTCREMGFKTAKKGVVIVEVCAILSSKRFDNIPCRPPLSIYSSLPSRPSSIRTPRTPSSTPYRRPDHPLRAHRERLPR